MKSTNIKSKGLIREYFSLMTKILIRFGDEWFISRTIVSLVPRLYFLCLAILFFHCNSMDSGQKVSIKQVSDGFQLHKNGKPYFIKGAVGWNFLDELKEAGT